MEAFLKNSSGFSSSEKQELLSNAKVYQDKLAVIADNYDVQSKAAKDNDEKMFSVEALVQAVSDEVEQHYNDDISRLEKLQQHIFVGYGLTAFLTLAFLVFLVRQFNTISQRLTEVSAYIRVSGEQNLVTASSLHQTSAKNICSRL